jgi:hypothetical protein
MKRFRMHKQKVVKPDGRWMYLYTFEEEPSAEEEDSATEREDSSSAPRKRQSTEVEY